MKRLLPILLLVLSAAGCTSALGTTTCTITLAATYTTPVCIATQQGTTRSL
jgi:hypothetical protein